MGLLSEKDAIWLKKIHTADVPDKERQERYAAFYKAFYSNKSYGVKETEYVTISVDEWNFGKFSVDKRRHRQVETPKISKSNQPK